MSRAARRSRYHRPVALCLPVVVALVVAFAGVAQAAALTCTDLMRLHRSGMDRELLIELIQESDTLEPLSSGQESLLVAAGLPEDVLAAYRERSLGPDDERLKEIVELVRAGVDVDLVVAVVERSQPPLRPTSRDLEFVTRSQLPQRVLDAVVAAAPRQVPSESKPADDARLSEPALDQSLPLAFAPLRRMYRTTIGLVSREVAGRLDLDEDGLRFSGLTNHARDVEVKVLVLEQVWLDCSPGPTCYELGIKTAHGDAIRLRDDDWRTGGNAQILALFEALKARHPWLEFRTNVGR